MKYTCEHCQTRYAIPDERVVGKTVKIRCSKCRGVMHVVGPTSAFDPEFRPPTFVGPRPALARAASDATDVPLDSTGKKLRRWWVGINERPHGPYTPAEIHQLVNVGDVTAKTLMWTKGMGPWARVCESAELAWAYERVLERLESDVQGEAPTDDVFAAAGMVGDEGGYFPNPTLKSGWLILDERTQAYLETCATRGDATPAGEPETPAPSARASRAPLAIAAALGVAALVVASAFWNTQTKVATPSAPAPEVNVPVQAGGAPDRAVQDQPTFQVEIGEGDVLALAED